MPGSTARLRLFCFPYAGGSAAVFRGWAERLGPHIEVRPVELPGRGSRRGESCCTRLRALVDVLAERLHPDAVLSFAMFGHSMGALIAFELAHELRRRLGVEPVHLFMSAHRAPQLPPHDSPIHRLATPAFIDRLRRFNGTPPELLENPELMDLVLPIVRADFEVCETYAFRDTAAPLRCPISAFGGAADPEVSLDELHAWRPRTRGAFSVRTFSGDHFYLNESEPPLLQAIADELGRFHAARA